MKPETFPYKQFLLDIKHIVYYIIFLGKVFFCLNENNNQTNKFQKNSSYSAQFRTVQIFLKNIIYIGYAA